MNAQSCTARLEVLDQRWVLSVVGKPTLTETLTLYAKVMNKKVFVALAHSDGRKMLDSAVLVVSLEAGLRFFEQEPRIVASLTPADEKDGQVQPYPTMFEHYSAFLQFVVHKDKKKYRIKYDNAVRKVIGFFYGVIKEEMAR